MHVQKVEGRTFGQHYLARKEECGSVIVPLALIMTVLIGFVGLAVDVGYYFLERSRLQASADAIALACAYKGYCITGSANEPGTPNWAIVEPLQPYESDLFLTVGVPCPGGQSDSECMTVEATKTWPTYFARLLGVTEMSVTAHATSISGTKQPLEFVTPAIYATSPGGAGLTIRTHGPIYVEGDLVSASSSGINGTAASNPWWGLDSAIYVDGDVVSAGPVAGALNLDDSANIRDSSSYETPPFPFPDLPSTPPDFCNYWPTPCESLPGNLRCTSSGEVVQIPSGNYGTFTLNIPASSPACTYQMSGVYTARENFRITNNGTDVRVEGSEVLIVTGSGVVRMEAKAPGSVIQLGAKSGSDPYAGVLVWDVGGGWRGVSSDGESSILDLRGAYYSPNNALTLQREGSNAKSSSRICIGGVIAPSVTIQNTNTTGPSPMVFSTKPNDLCEFSFGGGSLPSTGGQDSGALPSSTPVRLIR